MVLCALGSLAFIGDFTASPLVSLSLLSSQVCFLCLFNLMTDFSFPFTRITF